MTAQGSSGARVLHWQNEQKESAVTADSLGLQSIDLNRFSSRSVCKRRGCPASDDCRSFMDQLIVLKRLHHEQGIIHPAGHIAGENGITHMPAPHGKPWLSPSSRSLPRTTVQSVSLANTLPAGFQLVIDIHQTGQPPQPAGQSFLSSKR